MLCTLLGSSMAFAHENPDQKATCYLFKNNKLQSKSACIVKSAGGAGGMYTILKFGKKSYHFETNTMTENWKTIYYQSSNLNKFIAVNDYSRDKKTLKILKDSEISIDSNFLFCYKTKDGKLDICYD